MKIEDKIEVTERTRAPPAPFAEERRDAHLSVYPANIDALLQQFSAAGIKIDRDLSYYIAPDCDISLNAELYLGKFDLRGYQLVAEKGGNGQKERLEIRVITDKIFGRSDPRSPSDVLPGEDRYFIHRIKAALSYTGEDEELGNKTIGSAKQIMQEFYSDN